MAKLRSKQHVVDGHALERILRHSRPNLDGEVVVQLNEAQTKGMAICLSCGATDRQVMIRKHRKWCPWKQYWAAIELFRAILEESRVEAKKKKC